MKNTSIRKRVTLYYSLVLILITLLVFSVFLYTASRQSSIISKDTVMKAVQNSFDDIEYDNNVLEVDNDFDSYRHGVILLIYSENGSLVKGSMPTDFPSYTPLSNGEYQEIDTEDSTWLVYDLYNTYESGQAIWVRGVYDMDGNVQTLSAIMRVMFIVLPLILILAIIAGRRITRKALDPVMAITNAAESIGNGNDLSKRLPLSESKDELYHLTETLNRMIARLEDAFKAEKEFSSDVSHELKTPISVILAECEYTLQENRQIDEYKESLENIQKRCSRTMSLIQQLLQVSRNMDKERALEKEVFDLSQLCESITGELKLSSADRGVKLTCDIEKGVMINADETQVMRMIINLITNGVKYRRTDVDSWVNVKMRSGSECAVIEVSDNGIGIKKEDLSQIFHRFYKVEKSRSTEENSFGLGLSMVQWIAEAHGGSVEVQSQIGKGSCFTVTLPL